MFEKICHPSGGRRPAPQGSQIGLLAILVWVLGASPTFSQGMTVQVTAPERRDIERTFALPGTLKPYEEATL